MAQNKTRELETLTPHNEAALAAAPQLTVTHALANGGSQKAVPQAQAALKGKVDGVRGKRKPGGLPDLAAQADGVVQADLAPQGEALVQEAFSGEGWQLAQAGGAEGAPSGYFSDAGGGRDDTVQLAQLELPSLPQGGASAPSAGTAAGGVAAGSSLGGMAGIFGAAAGLGLAAGGGGGSQSAGSRTSIAAPAPTESVSGRLVNGYIKNALVFQDDNGDGVLTNDKDGVDEPGEEPYTHTDANGNFKLEGASADGGPLIAQPDPERDTEDTSTGLAVTNVFKAPAKATVISPLSTLLEAGAASGLTEQQLKTAFGIDQATPLLDFNPVAQARSSDAAEAAIARKFKAVNVMVSNLMDVGNSLIGGAKGDSATDFSKAVVSSLVNTVKNSSAPLDMGSGSVVGSILTKAAEAASVSPTALSAVITGAATQLSQANGSLLTAAQATYSDPDDALVAMAKIEKVVQADVSSAVQSAAASPSNTAAVNALTELNLTQKVDQVSVPAPLIFETLGFETAEKVVAASINGAGAVAQLLDGNTVMKVTKPAGAADRYNASGVGISTGTHSVDSNVLATVAPLDLISGNKLGMWVHSARAGTTVTLEVGDSDRGGWPKDGNFVAARAVTTKAGWEYLGFDFSKPIERYVEEGNPNGAVPKATKIQSGVTYDMLNVFFDLGQSKTADQTYYFDKLGYFTSTPGAAPADIAIELAPAIPSGYTLAWSDEFGGDLASVSNAPKSAVDSAKWDKDLGAGGWGNGESQTYTDSINNAYTQNGALYIAADKTGSSITSARLKSVPDVGPNAYVEVRAKVPVGQGAWPAAWLLGQGQWPDTGEIDIMEWSSAYFNPSQTQSALHFKGEGNPKDNKAAWTSGDTQKKGITTLGTPVTEFHTYQVWWTQDYIRFGVDANSDNAYYTYNKPANATSANWPFTGPMDLILNLAIGGSLGGTLEGLGDFDYEMVVDYVRVYQGPAQSVGQFNGHVSFESDDATGYALGGATDFGGNVSSLVSTGAPAGATGNVAKVVNGAESWSGTTFLNLSGGELISAGNEHVSMRVYMPDSAARVVKLKLEDRANGANNKEVDITTTAAGWQTLDFDFAGVNHNHDFNKASIFFDFAGTNHNGGVYYFDDVKFGSAYVTPSSYSAPSNTKVTFENEDASGYVLGGDNDFGGNVSSLLTSGVPAGARGSVAKVVNGAEGWSGTTFMTLTNSEFINAQSEHVSMRVYVPDGVSHVIKLKLEDKTNGSNNKEVDVTTTASGWQTLDFDFAGANHGLTYNKASVFFDFNGVGHNGAVYYFDDVAYNIKPLQVNGHVSFESDDATGYALGGATDFGGNVSSLVSTGAPAGATGNVAKVVNGAESWSGTTFLNLSGGELISAGNEHVSMRVYMPDSAARVVKLKLEDRANGANNKEVDITTTAAGWQTLDFDFAGVNHNHDFNKASIFFDFAGTNHNGGVYYFDDVKFGSNYGAVL